MMPIRPEYRRFYGAEWRRYRVELIRLRGTKCTLCGSNMARYLNLSHTTHDPRTSSVRLVCAACHTRIDAPHRLAVWRRNRARRVGQAWLLPELEYAPYPAWMIPREALLLHPSAGAGRIHPDQKTTPNKRLQSHG